MATTDEAKLATVQAITGTNLGWNGDWLALFDFYTIAGSDFNGRLLTYINTKLATTYTNLPQAQQAIAEANGATNWTSMGTFVATIP